MYNTNMKQKPLNQKAAKRAEVSYLTVDSAFAGQRIDNFLITRLKGVPKSRIYRMLRGEVRVNKKRVEPSYRLQEKDSIRIPPVQMGEKAAIIPASEKTQAFLGSRILYEDEQLLIINKPSGMSVHGGSTVRVGVIEALRAKYPRLPQLELAHRLDADTSGCLILAKKRSVLRELHTLLREGQVRKIYWALTRGQWKPAERRIEAPLQKYHLKGGERIVRVHPEGKASLSVFRPLEFYNQATLVEVHLYTGRTHQIRVHAQYAEHPIAGDERYGDEAFNQKMQKQGLKRLFLHAKSIEFTLSGRGKPIYVEAPLDEDLQEVLKNLE
ncbi:MAG TPA: 23S rRNA pseudouridine(955/2504/2580) synthase RluC [Gammaproteobacteria bacterium]|nr:23S rRNA pseudouridine(955/2504/2580) synthase RluC [Gammaproteobacteria bacterium]